MTYCILMAGGVGNRVGAGIPKQFVEVFGKPVITYTMQKLQQCSDIDAIVFSEKPGPRRLEIVLLNEVVGITPRVGGSEEPRTHRSLDRGTYDAKTRGV